LRLNRSIPGEGYRGSVGPQDHSNEVKHNDHGGWQAGDFVVLVDGMRKTSAVVMPVAMKPISGIAINDKYSVHYHVAQKILSGEVFGRTLLPGGQGASRGVNAPARSR
jgi:hypothetical protein